MYIHHLKHGDIVRTVLYHARDNAVSGLQALRQSVERPSPRHTRAFLPDVAEQHDAESVDAYWFERGTLVQRFSQRQKGVSGANITLEWRGCCLSRCSVGESNAGRPSTYYRAVLRALLAVVVEPNSHRARHMPHVTWISYLQRDLIWLCIDQPSARFVHRLDLLVTLGRRLIPPKRSFHLHMSRHPLQDRPRHG